MGRLSARSLLGDLTVAQRFACRLGGLASILIRLLRSARCARSDALLSVPFGDPEANSGKELFCVGVLGAALLLPGRAEPLRARLRAV